MVTVAEIAASLPTGLRYPEASWSRQLMLWRKDGRLRREHWRLTYAAREKSGGIVYQYEELAILRVLVRDRAKGQCFCGAVFYRNEEAIKKMIEEYRSGARVIEANAGVKADVKQVVIPSEHDVVST